MPTLFTARSVRRRLAGLGFAAGAVAGALAYLAAGRHEIAFVVFVTVWYGVAYGVARGASHPEHRAHWLIHIGLFPVAWLAGTAAIWLRFDNAAAAVFFAGVGALLLQLLVTNVLLRDVRADQLHDVRRRLGIE
jgi:hypothetical protein